MNATTSRHGMSWSTRVLLGLVLLLAGAAAATWVLAHYQSAARLVGVAPAQDRGAAPPPAQLVTQPQEPAAEPAAPPRIAELEARLARVESATQRAQGSAGRADALVVAFAARRAIERGVALGYLETLLVARFGPRHERAVATIVTAARQPVRLTELIDEYETLGPDLRRGGPQDSWWTNFKRELGTLVEVHRADRPSTNADARYNLARQRLSAGDVEQALAITMRLPGAVRAEAWAGKARRYIAARRALDEIESAALLGAPAA